MPEGKSMGHSFDGIEEINNPLPKWWTYLFIATIIFSLAYLAVYPGLGSYAGIFGWKSSEQDIRSLAEKEEKMAAATAKSEYDREIEKAESTYGAFIKKYAYTADGQYKAIEEVAKDEQALQVGKRLFLQNCSQCHGSSARGGQGFPNLTDDDWLYGGSAQQIKTSIMKGRKGVMPAGGGVPRSDEEVDALIAYTLSLSGRKVNAQKAEQGKALFAVCSGCHGADGRGLYATGAPNLTDKIWLYGGSRKAVEQSIRHGRIGVMPTWEPILGEDKVHLISAYIYSLSNK